LSGASLHPYEYDLRLRRGILLGYAAMDTRRGFVLALRTSDPTTVGLAEAAPAWWAGDESPAATRDALQAAVDWFVRTEPDLADMEATLRAGAGLPAALRAALAPSRAAASAVATAIADHQARKSGLALAEYLGGALSPCTTNALVVAEDASAVAGEVVRALSLDYRTVKLKVGNRPVEVDRTRIAAAVRAGAGRIRLRLDANRGWSLEQALGALDAVNSADIEYVEEPLAEPDETALDRLRAESGIAVALDESITEDEDVDRFADHCDVVVLKPGRLGGPWPFLARARRATAAGLGVTVTDALETCIGRSVCLQLASACGDGRRTTGLAGAALLDEDLCLERNAVRGAVVVPTGPGILPLETLARRWWP